MKKLSTPAAVKKSQEVYAGIKSGQVKDAKAALNKAHGKDGK